MNNTNLKLLANYLVTLEPWVFDMRDYVADPESGCIPISPGSVKSHHECGSVGCALGHAPFVEGLPRPEEGECWAKYSERVFGLLDYPPQWEWCFASAWANVDNTPKGAAARINYLLEHGLPYNWEEQMEGEEELCYNVEN